MRREYYDSEKPCPKCLKLEHRVVYKDRLVDNLGVIRESDPRLSVTCTRCGYSWDCTPYDLPPEEMEPGTVYEIDK